MTFKGVIAGQHSISAFRKEFELVLESYEVNQSY